MRSAIAACSRADGKVSRSHVNAKKLSVPVLECLSYRPISFQVEASLNEPPDYLRMTATDLARRKR